MAKHSNAIVMLLVDASLSLAALILLSALGGLSELVLWVGTVLFGLAIARMSASAVVAVLDHLPGKN